METNKAAFSLEKFYFEKVLLDNTQSEDSEEIKLDFHPSGEFYSSGNNSLFDLKLRFRAYSISRDKDNPDVDITLKATFKFDGLLELDEVPSYFYGNSIAIVFPYIRAFVSTLSLQSNHSSKLIVLPTLNLSQLSVPLRENTIKR
jgi:preprotein translocase subunit SecB